MKHYELPLFAKRGAPVARSSVEAFLQSARWLGSPDAGERKTYTKPDTGASLLLVPWVAAHGTLPEGLDSTGLAFEIPFLRPGFFAAEALDAVVALCEALNFTVIDAQAPATLRSNKAGLLAGWRRGNQSAAREAQARGELPARWASARAETWWLYARDKDRLHGALDDTGVFVPRVFLFAGASPGSEVRTAMTWSDCIATLFPPAELILVLDRSNEPTASGQDTRLRGLAERDAVVGSLGDVLERVETQAGELPYLPPSRCALARLRFRSLHVEPPPDPLDFRGISPSDCIDDEDAPEPASTGQRA